MDSKLAQDCMNHGIAVIHKGKRYYRINAIISRKYTAGERKDNRAPRLVVELYDGVSNAVIIVPVEEIELISAAAETPEA